MKEGEFYKMDFRAWNVGTVDLTLEQEAAYLRICHAMYDARGPIPNSGRLLRGIFRCGNTKASALVRQLLDAGKIELTDTGAITNRRVTEELAKRDRRSTEQSANGKRGGTASGAARKKANEIKDRDEAHASTERSREEKRREEESREEEIREEADAPLPWEVDQPEPKTEPRPDPKPEPKPDPEPKPKPAAAYAFEHGIIKLNQRDYDRFEKAYSLLNLDVELMGLADYLEREKGRDWYNAMVGILGSRQRKAQEKAREIKANAEALAAKAVRHVPGQSAL